MSLTIGGFSAAKYMILTITYTLPEFVGKEFLCVAAVNFAIRSELLLKREWNRRKTFITRDIAATPLGSKPL